MRQLGRVLMVVMMVSMVCGSAQGKYGGGTGEANDPYQIWDANHMQAIGADANDWDKQFVLMADIDLSQFDGKDGREEFNYIGYYWTEDESGGYVAFEGVFDGNGHRIYNFNLDGGYYETGLFGVVSGGTINDLGLIDPNVTGMFNVGSLVGTMITGTIENCYVEGGCVSGNSEVGALIGHNGGCLDYWEVCWSDWGAGTISDCYVVDTVVQGRDGRYTSARVGGLVGTNWGKIMGCYSAASVTASGNHIGGLVGLHRMQCDEMCDCECTDALVAYCYSTGSVDGNDYVGGLIGHNQAAVTNCYTYVSDCYAKGSVNGEEVVGGLIGYNTGSVTLCYSLGGVNGETVVGGLVGQNGFFVDGASVTECYSAGVVSGSSSVGGLVGLLDTYSSWVEKSFWDIETSGERNMCGSHNDPSGNACDPNYGKTTAQMKQQSNFTDWDFINTWNIGENQTYPYLRTVPASDINKDNITNFLDLCIMAEQWMRQE